MGWNLPDDWGAYYYRCEHCGERRHASEGCEPCEDAHDAALDALAAAECAQDVFTVLDDYGPLLGWTETIDAIPDSLEPSDEIADRHRDAIAADCSDVVTWCGGDGVSILGVNE